MSMVQTRFGGFLRSGLRTYALFDKNKNCFQLCMFDKITVLFIYYCLDFLCFLFPI